jgi:hypothetical protein
MKLKQIAARIAALAVATTSANAALTNWDFDTDNTYGWTAVQGEAFLRGDGV